VGYDPSWDFSWKKIIQAQKRIAKDILILECKKNNKDDIFLFQEQIVKINKL